MVAPVKGEGCPTCGAEVERVTSLTRSPPLPPIEEIVRYKPNDQVVGFVVHPCGHGVLNWQWSAADGWAFNR